MISKNLGTFAEHPSVSLKENKRKAEQEAMYNKRNRSVKLKNLESGESVWIIDMRLYGKVVKRDDKPNSYIVKTERGSTSCRNRWHLIPAPYKHDVTINKENLIIPFESDSNPAPPTTRANNQSDADNTPSEAHDVVVRESEGPRDNHGPTNNVNTPQASETAPTDTDGVNRDLRRSSRPIKPPQRYNP